jgi:tetratricopeptide (TPR) repeat protein
MDKETLQLLQKGREHYEAKEFEKAEAYLTKAVTAGLRYADVMNMLGVIHHGKGQLALAQDYFEKAMVINPNYIEAALNLAVTYNDVGQYSKAKALYTHVTGFKKNQEESIEPFAKGKLANMHADLGQAYAEVGDLDKSIEQYRQALDLCGNYVDIRTRLGQVLRDAGQLESACEEFERVKVTKPRYVPARISLGITYLALGDRELAKREWEAVLDIEKNNLTANMYLKIVDQMIAQEEAHEAGLNLEVAERTSRHPDSATEELSFSFDGTQSSVSSIGNGIAGPPPEDDEQK